MLGLLEGESESVEHLACAEPDELVRANVDVHAEGIRVGITEARVDTVGGDDEVVIAPLGVGGVAFGFELDPNAELARAILQDFEQPLAADTDESVADDVIVSPPMWTSMSSQCANSVIDLAETDRWP